MMGLTRARIKSAFDFRVIIYCSVEEKLSRICYILLAGINTTMMDIFFYGYYGVVVHVYSVASLRDDFITCFLPFYWPLFY